MEYDGIDWLFCWCSVRHDDPKRHKCDPNPESYAGMFSLYPLLFFPFGSPFLITHYLCFSHHIELVSPLLRISAPYSRIGVNISASPNTIKRDKSKQQESQHLASSSQLFVTLCWAWQVLNCGSRHVKLFYIYGTSKRINGNSLLSLHLVVSRNGELELADYMSKLKAILTLSADSCTFGITT